METLGQQRKLKTRRFILFAEGCVASGVDGSKHTTWIIGFEMSGDGFRSIKSDLLILYAVGWGNGSGALVACG